MRMLKVKFWAVGKLQIYKGWAHELALPVMGTIFLVLLHTQASMNVEQCVHKIPVIFYLNFKATIFTSCYVWLTSGFGRTIFDIP